MKSKTKAFQGGVFLGLFLISLLMQMLINNGEVFFDVSLSPIPNKEMHQKKLLHY